MTNTELSVTIADLVRKFGMRKILETLIDSCGSEQDYVVKLRNDLQTTLDNYEARYEH